MPKGKSTNRTARTARLCEERREAIRAVLNENNSSQKWLGKNHILKLAIVRTGGSINSNPSPLWYKDFRFLEDTKKLIYRTDLGYRWGDTTGIHTSDLDSSIVHSKEHESDERHSDEAKSAVGILAPEFFRTLGQGYIALADSFEKFMRDFGEKITALEKQVAALRASSESSLRGEVDTTYREVLNAIERVRSKK